MLRRIFSNAGYRLRMLCCFGNKQRRKGLRIFKQIDKSEIDKHTHVLCVSKNKDFPSEEIPKSLIDSVFKVILSLTNEGY